MGSRPGDPKAARDANRIAAAARDAGVKRIDQLLVTHFHPDHDGGVVELSQLMPIEAFIDHGSLSKDAATNPDYQAAFDAYVAARGSKPHIEPKPGDRIPFGGLDITVVSSAGSTIAQPLPGAGERNESCQATPVPAGDPYENPRSTGILIRYGKFRFLDVGDLSGEPLFNLVCPTDRIGAVDVYLVAHHGGPDVADPAILNAFRPRVAVLNNGLKKGGAPATFETLHHYAGSIDVWQLHRSAAAADGNFAEPHIANLDESTAHWIKLVARADGSFRIFNQRTGAWADYRPANR